jgi:hypothetical protein
MVLSAGGVPLLVLPAMVTKGKLRAVPAVEAPAELWWALALAELHTLVGRHARARQ